MTIIATTQEEKLPSKQITATAGQYLTFVLGGEIFTLSILSIKEIIEYGHLTEVPMMPAFVRGVINLRGRVVPIIDLQARFGKGATQIHKRTGIVIVESTNPEDGNQQDIGIIVDAVNEVVDISHDEIEAPPSFGTGIRPDFIIGMAKRDNHFAILLNINRVLSVNEMADLSQTAMDQQAQQVLAAQS